MIGAGACAVPGHIAVIKAPIYPNIPGLGIVTGSVGDDGIGFFHTSLWPVGVGAKGGAGRPAPYA